MTYFDEDDVAAEADVVVDDDASFNDPEDGINVTPGSGEAVLDAIPTESLSNEKAPSPSPPLFEDERKGGEAEADRDADRDPSAELTLETSSTAVVSPLSLSSAINAEALVVVSIEDDEETIEESRIGF